METNSITKKDFHNNNYNFLKVFLFEVFFTNSPHKILVNSSEGSLMMGRVCDGRGDEIMRGVQLRLVALTAL